MRLPRRPRRAPRRPVPYRSTLWPARFQAAALALVLTLVFAPLAGLKLSYVVGGINYVALGDSRAAGPAALRWLNEGPCARTSGSYPILLAAALQVANFDNASCSGAVVANILDTPQKAGGGQLQPLQIDAVNLETNLVTVSIGGNDVRWYNILRKCYTDTAQDDARCRDNEELNTLADLNLTKLRPRLDALFDQLHRKAPRAEVFIASHGGMLGYTGCWPILPVSYWDLHWMRGFFTRMNAIIKAAAERAGATYVDTAAASVGHDVCRPRGQKWYEGQVTTSSAASMHPNDDGMRAIAEIFLTDILKDPKFSGVSRPHATGRD